MWLTLIWTFCKTFFSFGNLSKWFSYLVVHWKEFLIGTVVALFAYQMFSPYQFLFGLDTVPSLNSKIATLEKKLSESEANFNTCKAGNEKLSAAIDNQNTKIREWGEIATKIDASTAELKTKIEKSRAQSKKDVESILNEQTPQTCEEAIDYLRKGMDELKWSSPR